MGGFASDIRTTDHIKEVVEEEQDEEIEEVRATAKAKDPNEAKLAHLGTIDEFKLIEKENMGEALEASGEESKG
jgi:hypothetical protein